MCNLQFGITLFALVLHLICTALSQSESSKFFMDITIIICIVNCPLRLPSNDGQRKSSVLYDDFVSFLLICFCFFCFSFVLDASSASYPQCHIMGKLADCPKNEETVDPNSIVPVNCSIKSGGTSNQNTTWRRVYDLETPKKCLVLKTENSETRIYLASTCELSFLLTFYMTKFPLCLCTRFFFLFCFLIFFDKLCKYRV